MDKSKYEIVDLSTDTVDRIFEGARKRESQGAYLASFFAAIYGFPVLENDRVEKVDGFPKAAPNLAEMLMERAAEFDKEFHPNVMAGGLMMNNGPSKAEWLDGMEVAVPPLRLEGIDGRVSPGEARGILFDHPRRNNEDMNAIEWIRGRSDSTVKARTLVEDAMNFGPSDKLLTLAEEIKDPIFTDEYRHAGPKTTLQVAEMLREDGALLYLPPYLDEEYADEALA